MVDHNTYPPQEPLRPDPTVKALSDQLSPLREAQELFYQAQTMYQQAHQALEALVPAFEVQIRGLNGQIEQLRRSAEETENTYADVVNRLENQVSMLKIKLAKSEQSWKKRLAETESKLQARIDSLQSNSSQSDSAEGSDPSPKGPFTHLNIFDL